MSHPYSGADYGVAHGDARLGLADLYAFPKPGDNSKSILIMNIHPSDSVNPPGGTTMDVAIARYYRPIVLRHSVCSDGANPGIGNSKE